MKSLLLTLGGVLVATALFTVGIILYEDRALAPATEAQAAPPMIADGALQQTVNTTRVGSDDPIETAVAVAQVVYPVTEEENSPGAVVLVNQGELAEVLAAASRVQHFPVNAPLLYVDEGSLPALTRAELLRLKPEGVPMDGNVQVYLVGSIGEAVRQEVEALGYRVRALTAPDPVALSEVLDDWTSTQHGDHKNAVVVANLDNLGPAIPSAFWNAHAGDGLVFVTNDGVPETTRRILQRRANGPWLYLFGDESVISNETARELAQLGHVTRIPAATAAEASAYFAGFVDEGRDWGAWYWQGERRFGWANRDAGRNAIFVNLDGPGGWQNALAATTLSHMGKHAPALIVGADDVPTKVQQYLETIRPYETAPQQQLLNHGWVIGGPQTISDETMATLDLLLEGTEVAAVAREEQGE
jgi:hypothetical protein